MIFNWEVFCSTFPHDDLTQVLCHEALLSRCQHLRTEVHRNHVALHTDKRRCLRCDDTRTRAHIEHTLTSLQCTASDDVFDDRRKPCIDLTLVDICNPVPHASLPR